MEYTQTQLIEAALAGTGSPMTLEQIIGEEIRQFKQSAVYADLRQAGEYYCNRSEIQEKTNDIEERSNVKIEHPIYRRVVDQKVRYLLARPWTVSTEDKTYAKALGTLFDSGFRRKIRRLGKNAVRDGIGWIQPYIDNGGRLAFTVLPGHEVVPLWKDEERQELDGFIRFYSQMVYIGQARTVVGHAEYWYSAGVRRFRDANNSGYYREVTQEPEPHFTLGDQGYNWAKAPLVWLRYNDEELPLLRFVKELIDDYNWQTSITADVLRDVAKFVYVLRNYGGEDLGQFVTELRKSLAIQVEGDGGVDKLQADVNVDAVMTFLDKQRRDLYDFASAVDTKDPNLGSASGKAIGFRYMDLDADCTDLSAELQTTFSRLKPFLDTWFQAAGRGDFSGSEFEIRFNMDMPVDETEIIANINASAGLLSKRTLLENHPWVKDVDRELERAAQEQTAAE
ncbi:MAG: phage portal protein [Lawsonibacter sp.]